MDALNSHSDRNGSRFSRRCLSFSHGFHLCLAAFVAWVSFAHSLHAQSGDKSGEQQPDRVPAEIIPPAPVLSPEEQINTFQLPPGFRVEVVAAEPLINTPVAVQFDHQGRLWAVEMSGYMRNFEGTGEDEAVGRIVILTDVDGDGRMDQRTVFLEDLVMPRSVMLFRDGALVAEPPHVWFARDTNGDGQADEKEIVIRNYATQNDPTLGPRSNPEHASNSLTWAMDNWIYSANHTTRYRYSNGTWVEDPTHFRGQWGLTQDDVGRLYFNSNSDQLRADFIPGNYLARNPNLRQPFGRNVQLVRDQRVWPARVNPGVNRGYQPNQLTPEGRLATFTGACGPVVYRGHQFPEEFRGNVFLCEPTGNLIRRNRITDNAGELSAVNPYERGEFLASTDERFRPVNLHNGPDGSLYIVDMARGLIQHRIYLTSYLRRQLASRDLEAPVHLGRIYRVVHEGSSPTADFLPAQPSTEQLLSRLEHPNGWWRDRAQQLLIERADAAAIPSLRKMVAPNGNRAPLGRLHALWTLEGLGALDLKVLESALEDPYPPVRIAALRQLESFLQGSEKESAQLLLLRRAGFLPGAEQLQLLVTLGEMRTPQADAILRILLLNGPVSRLRTDAALSGLYGRELEFIEGLLADPVCGPEKKDHAPMVQRLAECVANEASPDRLARLIDRIARIPTGSWQQLALLDGIRNTIPRAQAGRPAPRIQTIELTARPAGWTELARAGSEDITKRLADIQPLIRWPGDGAAAEVIARPLNEVELASFERGKELYPVVCGACHQPHGDGQEGLAPPIRESEWTTGSEGRLVRIVLHGLRDAITVKGQKWELNMPGFSEALDDAQIADLLTYTRREWGHEAEPVSETTVRSIRESEAKAERYDQWTETELLKLP